MPEDKNIPRPSLPKRIESFIVSLLGTFRYSPPPWMHRLLAKFIPVLDSLRAIWVRATTKAKQHREDNPRAFWAKTAALTVGLLVAIAGTIWYHNRPQPHLIEISGSAPGPTPLTDNGKPESITISFSESAARLDLVGKVVTKGIRLSPLVAGEWRFVNDRELKFTPTADWGVGEKYTVSLEKSLFAPHARLRDYTHRFTSAAFKAQFTDSQFYQDPKVAADKKVVATIKFTHAVNTKDFEKRVRLELAEKDAQGTDLRKREVPFTVSYDKFKGEAYLLSERLQLPASDSPLTLTLSKGMRAERGGPSTEEMLTRTVTVPGLLSFFKVSTLQPTIVRNDKYEPEQVILVETTAPLAQGELDNNLSAYLLPIDRPETPGQRAQERHHWGSPDEIGPEILKVSERLKLEPIPTELEHSAFHSYRFKAPVRRQLYIKVAKGTKAFGDYVLSKDFDRVARVPDYPRELHIMSEGALLSLSGKRKLSIVSRGISDIRMEVGRVIGNQVNHLITQAEGNFSHPIFQDYRFREDNIVERFYDERALAAEDPQKTQYTAFDFTSYMNRGNPGSRRGLFLFQVHKWNRESQTTESPQDQRLILITDLGVLAKHAEDGTHDVFVQSIATGLPVGGATVEVLGRNGIPVLPQTTSGDGKAHIPNLKDFTREKAPVAFVVRLGGDFSFLPYQRYDRQLNFSRFDIGGNHVPHNGDGLTAYLFSDRGIYRPGEEAHVGAIVRSNDWKVQADLPLEATVSDPRGLEVMRRKVSGGKDGVLELLFPTDESALTGDYNVSLYIIKDHDERALIGSTTIRVEEFEPDKLRIRSHLSQERKEGWVHPDKLRGTVSLQTLFGFPAANRTVKAEISLTPAPPVFKRFASFRFFDPSSTDKSFAESLGEATTDESGEIGFDLNLERFEKATYRLRFFAEGFEAEGGRGVGTESYALVSPLPYFVGYRADTELRLLKKASEHSVELIALDPALEKKKVGGLKSQWVEYKYVSSLIKQDNGTYKYQSVKKETVKSTQTVEIAAAGTKLTLNTENPGDYAYVIRDEANTVLNRIEYSVSGSANLERSLEKSSLLQMKLAKPDYGPGEEIEVQLVAPFTGAGLITIERDKVYAHRWFKASTTASVQRIRVPQNLEGNAYVNVTFVRGLDSDEIYTSPLSYAVAPFSISRERRRHQIDLEVAEKVLPGEAFKMRYKTDRAAKMMLFAVDEGILQVAHYQNPDPLSFFFQKRALQVTTSQILDQILPEFDKIEQESSSGGGEGSLLGKNLNPFRRRKDRAVVYWSGIVDSGPQFRELSFTVPDSFNGTLRVIAVAVSAEKMGTQVESAIVRGPFVISPTVPFFVAPNDQFQISAAIANDVEGSGKEAEIAVTLSTSGELEVVGNPKTSLKIAEKTEGVARFTLKAKERLGSATVKFVVEHKGTKLTRSTDLSVRPATHYQTVVHAGAIAKGSTQDVKLDRDIFPHLRNAKAMMGHLPLGYADGLLQYLTHYPYGCTEQQVSRAFPAMVLRKFPEFGNSPEKIQTILTDVMSVLRSRQNAEGAFGFWAANSHVSNFQAVYATHFLTEAKQYGYPVSEEMLNRALGYLSQLAQGDITTLDRQRTAAYAIYLMLRNGNPANRQLVNLYEKLKAMKEKAWQKDLTAAYLAGSYAILQDNSKAWGLLKSWKIGESEETDYEHFYDPLVRDTQYLYLLAKHFPDRLKELSGEEIEKAFGLIQKGGYNTINSSYSILALAAMAERTPDSPALKATLYEVMKEGAAKPITFAATRFPRAEYSYGAVKLKFSNGSDRPLFYSAAEGGFDRVPPPKETASGIEVTREYRNLKGSEISDTTLGEEIEVRLAVRAIQGEVWNAAIVDLLPGGFEVVRDSLRKSFVANSETPGQSANGGDGGDEIVAPISPEPAESEGDEGSGEGAFFKWFSIPTAWAESEDNNWRPDYVDIREDRVLLYGTVGTSAQIYSYRIKSTNEGKFMVPPIYAEGMYDRKVKANSKGGSTLEVKASGKSR